jgi:hypothetical protein
MKIPLMIETTNAPWGWPATATATLAAIVRQVVERHGHPPVSINRSAKASGLRGEERATYNAGNGIMGEVWSLMDVPHTAAALDELTQINNTDQWVYLTRGAHSVE